MKFSELKGDEALDALADMLEPAVEIISDDEVSAYMKLEQKVKAVSVAIKKHKKAVKKLLAIVDGADPETYEPSILTLPIKLLEILNDKEVVTLFQSQSPTTEVPFGSAMENTKVHAE